MIFSSLQSFYINCKHNNTFKLFRFYWQCFNTILSFLLYLLGENKFVYSTKLLPFNMKSINPIQKYPHVVESYAYILWVFFVICLFLMNFFWNIFNSKAIKVCCIIIINKQRYPMSFQWLILIKIYYICSIVYFRYIISWINTIKFRFVLIKLLCLKIC